MPASARFSRRAVLDGCARSAGLLALMGGAATACGRREAPRRPLTVLAEGTPDRIARVALWNREAAGQLGVPLELEHIPHGAGSADTRAAIAAQSQRPDLIWGDMEGLAALALAGRLAPLGDLVRRDRFDLKRFMPVALGPGYGTDGRLMALPDEVDARQLYFNRDHFDAAGLDVRASGFDFERPAPTWEALRRADLDLLAAPAPRDRTPFVAGAEGAPLELWGWQNGARWLDGEGRRADFATPAAVEALTWLVAHSAELANAERAAGAGAEFPPVARYGDGADQPAGHPFLRTAVSVCFESTRLVSTVAGWHAGFPLGYVEPPRRAAGHPLVSLSRAWGYALHRDAPDAAWDALRFLLGERAVVAGAAAGAGAAPVAGASDAAAPAAQRPQPLPGRTLWYPPFSGQKTLDLRLAASPRHQTGSKLLDEARDHGLEQLRHARFRRPLPSPDAVWPVLAGAFRQALRGMPPAEALRGAEREAQERLDRAWGGARVR